MSTMTTQERGSTNAGRLLYEMSVRLLGYERTTVTLTWERCGQQAKITVRGRDMRERWRRYPIESLAAMSEADVLCVAVEFVKWSLERKKKAPIDKSS